MGAGAVRRGQRLRPRAAEPRPETVRDLVELYVHRHTAIENYNLAYAALFGTLRRLGIDPMSWRGRVGMALMLVALLLGAPLVVSLSTGQWATAPAQLWALVAVGFTAVGVTVYGPLQRAIATYISLHRSITEEEGMRRLVEFDRRWFALRMATPAALLFVVGILAYLHAVQRRSGEPPLDWGTTTLGALLLYQVGEIAYSISMRGFESFVLRDHDYELYRLGPLDSVAIRRSVRGSNQIGLIVGLLATVFILLFVLLLGERPILTRNVAAVLLVVTYVATLAGVVLPRMAIRWIVQLEKEREMAPLQRRLDELAARVTEMSEEQWKELKRVKEAHDAIRDSGDTALPLRTVGRLFTSLILPTLTFLMTRFGEHFLTNVANQFRR